MRYRTGCSISPRSSRTRTPRAWTDLSISAEAMPTHAELSVFAASLHGTSAAASGTDVALVTDLAGLRLKQGPREPAPTVTALELPYRVVTSPLAPARWRHAIAPVTRRAHTELWHTRLGDNTSEAGADAATRIRALWSPDYRPKDKQNELIDDPERATSADRPADAEPASHPDEPRSARSLDAGHGDGRLRRIVERRR